MKTKATVIFSLLLIFSILISIAVVTAQETVYPLIALSVDELDFYGELGTPELTRTLRVVGLADEPVTVTLTATELYDNSSGKNVTLTLPQPFSVNQNVVVPINITIFAAEAEAGLYKGALTVTATTTQNATTTNLPVTAQIHEAKPLISPTQTNLLIILLALILVALLIRITVDSELLVVILGIIIVGIWIYTMVTSSFGDLNTIISTIVFTPFFGYVIAYVKDKRSEKIDKIKASRKIRSDGIKEDIELLRNVLGELATHFASFKPNLYAETRKEEGENISTSRRVLYSESGSLSRAVWDKYIKQGMISDLPVLELEKYYDFIKLYERHYSCARILTTKSTDDEIKAKLEDENSRLAKFEKFRAQYAEVETVLFVHLTYFLGLFSTTYLSPLKIEYPRVTRTLLKRLVDYEILCPADFFGYKWYEPFSDWIINPIIRGLVILRLVGPENERNIDRRKEVKRKFWEVLKEKEAELTQEKFQELIKEGTVNPEVTFEKWKENELIDFKRKLFKKIIEKWELASKDIATIARIIYRGDNVPTFYRKVEDEFIAEYLKLKDCAKDLIPLPDICRKEEDKKMEFEAKGSVNIPKEKKP